MSGLDITRLATYMPASFNTTRAKSRANEATMAKKAKGARMVVTVECTEQKDSGVPGMSRYTTYKNKKNTPSKLELMKYNKFLRRHTLHREIK